MVRNSFRSTAKVCDKQRVPHIYLTAKWLCECPAFRAMQDICVICYVSMCYVAHVRL